MFNLFDSTNDFDFILSQASKEVKINGINHKVLITNTDLKQNTDDKKITIKKEIKTGDLIQYDHQNWIVWSGVNGKRHSKYKALIRRCEYDITFNIKGLLITSPAVVESKVFNVENDQYMSLPAGTIFVTVQKNEDSLKIKINDRFISMGSAWKIAGVDRTKRGLITFVCNKDSFVPGDDQKKEIANLYTYIATITNEKPITIKEGNQIQLNVDRGMNKDTHVTFLTSDETIATVDQDGVVTAVSAGVATITAYVNQYVYDTIDVIVEDLPTQKYIVVEGPDFIYQTGKGTFTAKVMEGNTDTGEGVTWTLWADDKVSSTTLATFESRSANQCIIKADKTTGYVQLKAQNGDFETWKRLQIRSLI